MTDIKNAQDIEIDLGWLAKVIDGKINIVRGTASLQDLYFPQPPDLSQSTGPYADFVKKHGLGVEERLILALAMAPHIKPSLLRVFLQVDDTGMPHIDAGIRKTQQGEFFPTLETAMFVLGGDELGERLRTLQYFTADHVFAKENIIELPSETGQSYLSSPLTLTRETFDLLITGKAQKPRFGPEFPARLLSTGMSWSDLVLHASTKQQLGDLEEWLKHRRQMKSILSSRYRPGYRALFHGPPGTGKSMAAALIGKRLGMDVYRIDLSAIVSKYIGETEKNLEKVFSKALNRDWILFFDEADALFGKRTQVSDAHDRYANQEVSYLLQRVEDYNGLIVLASNFLHNMDHAFVRRFQSIVHFPMPGASERLQLWRNGMHTSEIALGSGIDLSKIAKDYELSGSGIINVVHYSCQKVLERGDSTVQLGDLVEGIRREFGKSGMTI